MIYYVMRRIVFNVNGIEFVSFNYRFQSKIYENPFLQLKLEKKGQIYTMYKVWKIFYTNQGYQVTPAQKLLDVRHKFSCKYFYYLAKY